MLDGIDDSEMTFSTYAVAPVIDEIQGIQRCNLINDEVQFGGSPAASSTWLQVRPRTRTMPSPANISATPLLDAKNPFSGYNN